MSAEILNTEGSRSSISFALSINSVDQIVFSTQAQSFSMISQEFDIRAQAPNVG